MISAEIVFNINTDSVIQKSSPLTEYCYCIHCGGEGPRDSAYATVGLLISEVQFQAIYKEEGNWQVK